MAKETNLHFSLGGVLPHNGVFVVNTTILTVSHLIVDDSGFSRQLHSEQFTGTEMDVLLPLFSNFPYYCPYDELFASFYYRGRTDKEAIRESHERLQTASQLGVWDKEVRPLRGAISRARTKLRLFRAMDIDCILESGYILVLQPTLRFTPMYV